MQDWKQFLRKITVDEIEQQISELKDRIRCDQEEIVYLILIRRGILASKEFQKISKQKAIESINQAINEANYGFKEIPLKTDSEGKINESN